MFNTIIMTRRRFPDRLKQIRHDRPACTVAALCVVRECSDSRRVIGREVNFKQTSRLSSGQCWHLMSHG
jgi:hypothetical protein